MMLLASALATPTWSGCAAVMNHGRMDLIDLASVMNGMRSQRLVAISRGSLSGRRRFMTTLSQCQRRALYAHRHLMDSITLNTAAQDKNTLR